MTLKEAHEIQRRELISLRAENARLKKVSSVLFPSEEKAALERHVRHLEQVIRTQEKRYENARSVRKHSESIRSRLELEIIGLQERIRALEEKVSSLTRRAEAAEAEVRMLNGTNRKLEKKLGTNSENSSLPSSAFPFYGKSTTAGKHPAESPAARMATDPTPPPGSRPRKNRCICPSRNTS